MGVIECGSGFARDPHRLRNGQLPLTTEPRPERLSIHIRHRKPEMAVGPAGIEHGEDMGMLQAGGKTNLALEALGPERGGELRVQDFDRNRAVVPKVLGQKDRSHATPAKLTLDAVAICQRGLQLGPEVHQEVRCPMRGGCPATGKDILG